MKTKQTEQQLAAADVALKAEQESTFLEKRTPDPSFAAASERAREAARAAKAQVSKACGALVRQKSVQAAALAAEFLPAVDKAALIAGAIDALVNVRRWSAASRVRRALRARRAG